MPEFWLDADIFIESAKKYYAFDIAPAFWKLLEEQAGKRAISSPIQAYWEVDQHGTDDLQNWIRQQKGTRLFTSESKAVAERYSEIADYVMNHSRYTMPNKLKFVRGADGWLVAHAMQSGGRVITYEVPAPESTQVKIPDVCNHFKVKYSSPLDMLRSLGFSLG